VLKQVKRGTVDGDSRVVTVEEWKDEAIDEA